MQARGPPRLTTRSMTLAASSFAVLVVAVQVGSAQAYSCMSDADCQYSRCNDVPCTWETSRGVVEFIHKTYCRELVPFGSPGWPALGFNQGLFNSYCRFGICQHVTNVEYRCERWSSNHGCSTYGSAEYIYYKNCPDPPTCVAGTYSDDGMARYACQPCPAGTWSKTGASDCDE